MKHGKIPLRDPLTPPTREMLLDVLGDSYDVYERFQNSLCQFDIEHIWQWYTPYRAWIARGQYFHVNSRGSRKEKNVYWLYVLDGYFIVTVWFLEKNREALLRTIKSDIVRQTILEANTLGKMATFPVMVEFDNSSTLDDIYTLINYKIKLEVY